MMFGNDDSAVRYGNGSVGFVEGWHSLATNQIGFSIACAVILILLWVLVEKKKQAIARELSVWTAWCVGFVYSAWALVANRRRGKAMRKKKQEEFSKRIQTVLLHMIDTAVEKNGVTQTMANNELRKLARAYPELRLAIWHPVDTKEAVVERRKNEDRNPDGSIIPRPLP